MRLPAAKKVPVDLAGFDAKDNLICSKKQKQKSYIFEKKIFYSLTNILIIFFKMK